MNALSSGLKNANTTVLGICAVLTALASAGTATFDADPTTVPDWMAVVSAIVAGVGLVFAKDGKTGSQP